MSRTSHRQRILRALQRAGVPTGGRACFAEMLRATGYQEARQPYVRCHQGSGAADARWLLTLRTGQGRDEILWIGDHVALAPVLCAWADFLEDAARARRRSTGEHHRRLEGRLPADVAIAELRRILREIHVFGDVRPLDRQPLEDQPLDRQPLDRPGAVAP